MFQQVKFFPSIYVRIILFQTYEPIMSHLFPFGDVVGSSLSSLVVSVFGGGSLLTRGWVLMARREALLQGSRLEIETS